MYLFLLSTDDIADLAINGIRIVTRRCRLREQLNLLLTDSNNGLKFNELLEFI
jgi:hypothetical protein